MILKIKTLKIDVKKHMFVDDMVNTAIFMVIQ